MLFFIKFSTFVPDTCTSLKYKFVPKEHSRSVLHSLERHAAMYVAYDSFNLQAKISP